MLNFYQPFVKLKPISQLQVKSPQLTSTKSDNNCNRPEKVNRGELVPLRLIDEYQQFSAALRQYLVFQGRSVELNRRILEHYDE